MTTSTNAVLADAIARETDGTLSYGGALAVLQDASRAPMTAALYADLIAAADDLNAAGGIATSPYVQQMFDNVVLGNSANASWNGGANAAVSLGDLSGSSTQTQFDELIGKWFLGTDLPGYADAGQGDDVTVGYVSYDLPLFLSGGPNIFDVSQGQVGDCWFLAALGETARLDPSFIENMIRSNGNGTFSVRFEVNGEADYVTVNNQLPTYTGGGVSQYDGSEMTFASSEDDLWVPLIEKALAELAEQTGVVTGLTYSGAANQYAELTSGLGEGITLVTGQSYNEYDLGDGSAAGMTSLLGALQNSLAAGDDVMLGTSEDAVSGNLVDDHMFDVVAINQAASTVTLYNPWGANSSGTGKAETFTISTSALIADGAAFFQAAGEPAALTSKLSGRLQLDITGYAVYGVSALADDLLDISAGGTLVLLGQGALDDDAVEGSGRVSNRATDTEIYGGLTLTGSTVWVDTGAVDQVTGTFYLGELSSDSVIVRVTPDALWELNDCDITGAGSSRFVNLGVLEQAGGESTIDANFVDQQGEISIGGALTFDSPSDSDRFVRDTIANYADAQTYAGALTLTGAVLDGSTISVSTVDLTSVRIIGDVTISSPTVEASALNLAAGSVLSFAGSAAELFFSGGVTGCGTIDLFGQDTVYASSAALLVGGVSLENYGDTTFADNASNPNADLELSTKSWTNDQVTIENEAGADWIDTAGAYSAFNETAVTGTSVFINNGTFIEDTSGGVSFGMSVENNGKIEAGSSVTPSSTSSPVFVFSDAVTGSGTIEISANDVTLQGAVAGGQTLNFNSVPAGFAALTLTLGDPQDFAGTITGFDQYGATNDEISLTSTDWQFQEYQTNSSASGGALIFQNASGAEAAINLSGAYDPSGFHATMSGAATSITYAG